MADHQRLEDLRRRVQKDPASIAFAQLAEEFRRAGQCQESIDVCRAGLAIHPGYLSARVTLGRALLELNQLDEAESELGQVLASAPENLAAIRGMAEIHHRRGNLGEALAQYRAALLLARNDPDLEQTVSDLTRKLEPAGTSHSAGGLSFEQARHELSIHEPIGEQGSQGSRGSQGSQGSQNAVKLEHLENPVNPENPDPRARAARVIAALEQWLGAIHVARAQRHA